MKCLSIRPPWGEAITLLGKRVENRNWRSRYRGPVLLHASRDIGSRWAFHEAIDWISGIVSVHDELLWTEFRDRYLGITTMPGEDGEPPIAQWLAGREIARGGIVGRARIVDVIAPGDGSACSALVARGVDMRWWNREQYGWILEDVEALPFVPLKGSLGLFSVDARILKGGA